VQYPAALTEDHVGGGERRFFLRAGSGALEYSGGRARLAVAFGASEVHLRSVLDLRIAQIPTIKSRLAIAKQCANHRFRGNGPGGLVKVGSCAASFQKAQYLPHVPGLETSQWFAIANAWRPRTAPDRMSSTGRYRRSSMDNA